MCKNKNKVGPVRLNTELIPLADLGVTYRRPALSGSPRCFVH